MHYWRDSSFNEIARLRVCLQNISALSEYLRYLELLDKGLREDALRHIENLLTTLLALSNTQQREIASLLCRETANESGHRLLPEPLMRRFITPAIQEWKNAEPENPEPLRWTGDLDDLIRAVELDPICEISRERLVAKILGFVGSSTHELPIGYLGVVEEDRKLLEIAKREAAILQDIEQQRKYLSAIEAIEQEIDNYQGKNNN